VALKRQCRFTGLTQYRNAASHFGSRFRRSDYREEGSFTFVAIPLCRFAALRSCLNTGMPQSVIPLFTQSIMLEIRQSRKTA
jgi:hypothetical protein